MSSERSVVMYGGFCVFQGFLSVDSVRIGLQHGGVMPALAARNLLVCLFALYILFTSFYGRDIV